MIGAALQGAAPSRPVPKRRGGILRLRGFTLGIGRTLILCIIFGTASLDYLVTGRGTSLQKRARWLYRWSRRCARLMGMKFETTGIAPRTSLVVANHLSYLDIIALSATTPSLFVAKSDVSHWPVFGAFARMAGTIFIDCARRLNVARTAAELKEAHDTGLPVVVFPEGTSSDGQDVLPFKSSLLQPACEGAIPIMPVAIDYTVAEGSAGKLISYWGEMTLIPPLINAPHDAADWCLSRFWLPCPQRVPTAKHWLSNCGRRLLY